MEYAAEGFDLGNQSGDEDGGVNGRPGLVYFLFRIIFSPYLVANIQYAR